MSLNFLKTAERWSAQNSLPEEETNLHAENVTEEYKTTSLPNTELVADRVVQLSFFNELTETEIGQGVERRNSASATKDVKKIAQAARSTDFACSIVDYEARDRLQARRFRQTLHLPVRENVAVGADFSSPGSPTRVHIAVVIAGGQAVAKPAGDRHDKPIRAHVIAMNDVHEEQTV